MPKKDKLKKEKKSNNKDPTWPMDMAFFVGNYGNYI